jgi:hypothetical protein
MKNKGQFTSERAKVIGQKGGLATKKKGSKYFSKIRKLRNKKSKAWYSEVLKKAWITRRLTTNKN